MEIRIGSDPHDVSDPIAGRTWNQRPAAGKRNNNNNNKNNDDNNINNRQRNKTDGIAIKNIKKPRRSI